MSYLKQRENEIRNAYHYIFEKGKERGNKNETCCMKSQKIGQRIYQLGRTVNQLGSGQTGCVAQFSRITRKIPLQSLKHKFSNPEGLISEIETLFDNPSNHCVLLLKKAKMYS